MFRHLRPGSRTVLYQPDSKELVVEFARRGFRLLLVHQDPQFLLDCRATLRAQGLQSQLMGSQELVEGATLQLARDFYDVFLYCQGVDDSMSRVTDWLGPNALLVVPRDTEKTPGPDQLTELESFTESFRAFR